MRSIHINTVHNVQIEYDLASAMSRVIAFLIDMMIVGFSWLLFALLLDSRLPEIVVFFFFPLTIFLLYYFFLELLMNGQTVGKRIIGLKVLRIDGERLTPGDLLLRTFFLLPDAWFSLGVPAVLLINTSSRAQRLGDMVAQTVVINAKGSEKVGLSDLLSIQTIGQYNPRFPAVRKLPESDMLLIKDTIVRQNRYNNEAHRRALIDLANRCRQVLDIEEETKGMQAREFLEILLKDYIVLTR